MSNLVPKYNGLKHYVTEVSIFQELIDCFRTFVFGVVYDKLYIYSHAQTCQYMVSSNF